MVLELGTISIVIGLVLYLLAGVIMLITTILDASIHVNIKHLIEFWDINTDIVHLFGMLAIIILWPLMAILLLVYIMWHWFLKPVEW